MLSGTHQRAVACQGLSTSGGEGSLSLIPNPEMCPTSRGDHRCAVQLQIRGNSNWTHPKICCWLKGLCSSRRRLGRCLCSRTPWHSHTARQGELKAPTGALVAGWWDEAVGSQGKGQGAPCIHNFHCSLINKSWKSHLLSMC